MVGRKRRGEKIEEEKMAKGIERDGRRKKRADVESDTQYFILKIIEKKRKEKQYNS